MRQPPWCRVCWHSAKQLAWSRQSNHLDCSPESSSSRTVETKSCSCRIITQPRMCLNASTVTGAVLVLNVEANTQISTWQRNLIMGGRAFIQMAKGSRGLWRKVQHLKRSRCRLTPLMIRMHLRLACSESHRMTRLIKSLKRCESSKMSLMRRKLTSKCLLKTARWVQLRNTASHRMTLQLAEPRMKAAAMTISLSCRTES